MSKILCYHGTSAENLSSILENGLLSSKNKVWNVSENAVYCYSKNLAKKDLGISNDEIEAKEDVFLRYAAESGTCAIVNSRKDCRIVVIKFEIDESELEDDFSCDNMDITNCVKRDIKPEEIKGVFISEDLSSFRLFILSNLLSNNFFINDAISFHEKKIAKILDNCEFWDNFEDIINLRPYQ